MYLSLLPRKSIRLLDSGEISIYLCLIFSIMISLIITIISAARASVLQVKFECAVENALCSAFAEYNRELLDRYNLMYIDLSYLSDSPDINNLKLRINEYYNDNAYSSKDEKFLFTSDLLDITGVNANIEEYSLATDYMGNSFVRQAVDYMKNLIGMDIAQETLNKIILFDSYEFDSDKYNLLEEKELKLLENNKDDSWEQIKVKEELKDRVVIKDLTVIMVIMGFDPRKLSKERIKITDTLFFRKKHKGNAPIETKDIIKDLNPIDNVLFSEYLMSKMGNYENTKENTKLKYEIEYILVGDGTDSINFEQVIRMIFAVRVLSNMVTINMSSDKMDTVKTVAEVIAALLEIPEILVTELIVFVWASAEGLLDVKEIIDGKKISVIKKPEEIKLSLEGVIGMATGLISDKSEETQEEVSNFKMGYEDYLRVFLYVMPAEFKAYRAMDMIEQDLRMYSSNNEYFCFDACTDYVKVSFSLESGYDYRFLTEKKYSYY